jgi:hypothetical protein
MMMRESESANGSNIRPKLLTTPQRLASCPSTTSVTSEKQTRASETHIAQGSGQMASAATADAISTLEHVSNWTNPCLFKFISKTRGGIAGWPVMNYIRNHSGVNA